jgi:uncharacterized protein
MGGICPFRAELRFRHIGESDYDSPVLLKRLTLPNGRRITAEVVSSPVGLAFGLMDRDSLPLNGGMLFVFVEPGLHPMWMVQTRMPLDIVWMGLDQVIVEIVRGAKPGWTQRLGGHAISSYALEIPSGCAEGLMVGQYVQFG